MESAGKIKNEGGENDLLDRIAGDPVFRLPLEEIDRLLQVRDFIGRAPEQVREFLAGEVEPLLHRAQRFGNGPATELKV